MNLKIMKIKKQDIYIYNYFKNLDLSEKDFLTYKDYIKFLTLKNINIYENYLIFEYNNKLYGNLEKKYHNLVNQLVYFIPFRKLRDKLRQKLLDN